MIIEKEQINALRSYYDSCFGCGTNNGVGLQLDGFELEEGIVSVAFNPRTDYIGFKDTLHGGIIATALDEVSAWSAMLHESVLVYTATLDIRYRKPAMVGSSFTLTGIVEERRGRRLTIAARLHGDDGVLAESKGVFIVAEELTF